MFGGLQISDEMLQAMFGMMNKGGGQGSLPGLGGLGNIFNPNTPGINGDPRAQEMLDSMQMNRGGPQTMGPAGINLKNIGGAQGFSPEGASHNKAMQDMAMGAGSGMAGASPPGIDPKTKMMMMVAQQMFNKSNEPEEPPQDVNVGANSINVGQMPNLDPASFTSQMQMQRGAPRQYGMGGMGGGMLQDPRKRRQPRFLFGG